MLSKESLAEVIIKNNLCLSNNPLGIKRNWPKSYIDHFYNNFCYKIYLKKKSPFILEINQKNELNLKLWELYFDKPYIKNLKLNNLSASNLCRKIKYDFIVINNLSNNNFLENPKNLNSFIKNLKKDGTLIIENIGNNIITIIKLYYFYFTIFDLKILDFRGKRFIGNNCLLIVRKKNKNNFSIFENLKNLNYLIIFLFFELILKIMSYKLIINK